MVSFLLFLTLVIFAFAVFWAFIAIEALTDPFADSKKVIVGLVVGLLIVPASITGAWHVNNYRVNYCPPLEPIAAPELAEVGEAEALVAELNEREQANKIEFLLNANDRLANELSLKTTALRTAGETILELQNRIKVLESTRIKSIAPTPTPIATPPTTAPARPTCKRPGCN